MQASLPVDRRRGPRLPGRRQDDPLYPAFVLLLLYGMRRGEILRLRWRGVDEEDGELRVRQHILRVHGELRVGPVKTAAGHRDLPLLVPAAEVLEVRRAVQDADRLEVGSPGRRQARSGVLVAAPRTDR
jgi:integrase